jgi:hypothetical protein
MVNQVWVTHTDNLSYPQGPRSIISQNQNRLWAMAINQQRQIPKVDQYSVEKCQRSPQDREKKGVLSFGYIPQRTDIRQNEKTSIKGGFWQFRQ